MSAARRDWQAEANAKAQHYQRAIDEAVREEKSRSMAALDALESKHRSTLESVMRQALQVRPWAGPRTGPHASRELCTLLTACLCGYVCRVGRTQDREKLVREVLEDKARAVAEEQARAREEVAAVRAERERDFENFKIKVGGRWRPARSLAWVWCSNSAHVTLLSTPPTWRQTSAEAADTVAQALADQRNAVAEARAEGEATLKAAVAQMQRQMRAKASEQALTVREATTRDVQQKAAAKEAALREKLAREAMSMEEACVTRAVCCSCPVAPGCAHAVQCVAH